MSRSTRRGRQQARVRPLVEQGDQQATRLIAQAAVRAAVQDEVGEGSVAHLAVDCRRGSPFGRFPVRARYDGLRAPVAQWTERGRPKACVGGSSPSGGAIATQHARRTGGRGPIVATTPRSRSDRRGGPVLGRDRHVAATLYRGWALRAKGGVGLEHLADHAATAPDCSNAACGSTASGLPFALATFAAVITSNPTQSRSIWTMIGVAGGHPPPWRHPRDRT